jgi:hypothetical protein
MPRTITEATRGSLRCVKDSGQVLGLLIKLR